MTTVRPAERIDGIRVHQFSSAYGRGPYLVIVIDLHIREVVQKRWFRSEEAARTDAASRHKNRERRYIGVT